MYRNWRRPFPPRSTQPWLSQGSADLQRNHRLRLLGITHSERVARRDCYFCQRFLKFFWWKINSHIVTRSLLFQKRWKKKIDRNSSMCELYIVKVRWHFGLHVFSSHRKEAIYQFTISGAQFSGDNNGKGIVQHCYQRQVPQTFVK